MADVRGAAWIDGRFVHAGNATISIFDSGFTGGVAVFDTLACWQGRLFKLERHLARFAASAHAAQIPLARSGAELGEVVIETVRRSGLVDSYVQLIATRGVRASPTEWPATGTLIVYAIPYVWIGGAEAVDRGLRVVVPNTRNLPVSSLDAKIKNFNRFHSYMAKLESDRAGADEVVMLDQAGYLTESRGANVFLAVNDVLYTPGEGVLWGITRETVFEIAAELGIFAEERPLTPYDLYNADEAFFATTAGGIIPVVEADGRRIGTGIPGPLTRRIHDRYWERHEAGPDTTRVYGE